ncbi:hypothetical protein KAH81_00730 [bacterium]|nr:hypothetical protein [bacterium]
MFKQLLSLWNNDDLLRQAFKETSEMLQIAKEFFTRAAAPLFLGESADKNMIYETDKLINKYEIDTRKKVLEHLSISRKQDTTAALVLTTIAVDIERLGDYSKNFFELWGLYGRQFSFAPIIDQLRTVNSNVDKMFDKTLEAFEIADSNTAHEVMAIHQINSKLCENIIAEMIQEEELDLTLTCNQRVLVALAARYLKRISAHLKNIASSVVNPFDRIGYKPSENSQMPHNI